MFEIQPQTIALALLLGTLLTYVKHRIANKGNSGVPLPPGPKGHWLWGVSIPDALYVSRVIIPLPSSSPPRPAHTASLRRRRRYMDPSSPTARARSRQ